MIRLTGVTGALLLVVVSLNRPTLSIPNNMYNLVSLAKLLCANGQPTFGVHSATQSRKPQSGGVIVIQVAT